MAVKSAMDAFEAACKESTQAHPLAPGDIVLVNNRIAFMADLRLVRRMKRSPVGCSVSMASKPPALSHPNGSQVARKFFFYK